MKEDSGGKNLLSHVDASGFPLQMRLEHEVRSLFSELHGAWKVVATEFPWEDPRTGRTEFVDMVIQRPPICFVIECKRRTGGAWTFLTPADRVQPRRHVRIGSRCCDANMT